MSSQSRFLGRVSFGVGGQGWRGGVLLGERLVQQPCYYGEVAALIVGGEEDRVLVLGGCGRHCERCAADR
jgi:hypothetical protein